MKILNKMTPTDILRCTAIALLCIAFPCIAYTASTDPQSKLTEKRAYYDDGKIMERSLFKSDGSPVERHFYYNNGKLQKTELFDNVGEKIEEARYDEEGKLDDGIDGWAAKRWVYKDRQLRVESTYGEDGHPIERKFYNELGDLVDRQYMDDGKIDPDEEFNRGSVVTAETDQFYNKYGQETGSETTVVD